MNRLIILAGVLGATAIGLGAWGAHGLEGVLAGWGRDAETLARRVENFNTAARYQLAAAIVCLAAAVADGRWRARLGGPALTLAAGALVFCTLLYAIALGPASWRWLGAVVPLGGLAMIAGWIGVAIVGLRRSPETSPPPNAELVRLEEILSHQQKLWQDLDDSLTGLRDQSDDQARRVVRLEDAARQLLEQQRTTEAMPDERPPHY
ncbi:MAG: SlyX family protein [Planctomycetota bacterium]